MKCIFVHINTGNSQGRKEKQRHQLAVHVQLGLTIVAAHLWHSELQQQKQEK